jgi:hypothetical protein
MTEFYETRAGRQFYESTMPRIADEMTRLNANLEMLILLLTDLGKKKAGPKREAGQAEV